MKKKKISSSFLYGNKVSPPLILDRSKYDVKVDGIS
jgi:hypothetical protein